VRAKYCTVEYEYKYNGKELQDELGLNMYDFGARNYDPALGRWMNIDPLAEKSRRFSPYTYALNNPVFFLDSDGMEADDWRKEKDGSLTYDPFLTKDNASTRLNAEAGETYAGRTQTEVIPASDEANGYTLNYISDGSISTSNPTTNNSSTSETASESSPLGDAGLKVGEVASGTSKLLMAGAGVVAIASVVTFQPEGLVLAGEMLELSSGVSTVGGVINTGSYALQGNLPKAGVELTSTAVAVVGGLGIDKIPGTEKLTKIITKTVFEKSIDTEKENIMENIK
jgi:RHS repeat-associated protein